jgi:nucleoid-associated protein YgaU
MTPHALFDADPLTTSWLIAIAFLLVLVVAVPLIRATLAGCIYAVAALTGHRHLRRTAARVMPRIAHLIGGIVIGTAAVAAPAMAAVGERPLLSTIDLDRDAGASSEAARPVKEHAAGAVYIVRTGDTLWDIAASHLEHPTDAATTEAWKAIWRANRAVIGDEPALIHPGQQLDLGILT